MRFIFIDEVEATGVDTIGELEHHVTFHISSKSQYKYRLHSGKKDILPRPINQSSTLPKKQATKKHELQGGTPAIFYYY